MLAAGDPSDPSASGGGATEGAADGEDTDSSRQAPTVLSLAYGCGQLAAALYEPLSMTACLLRDTPDPPPRFAQLRALLGQVQPDQVVTSGRQDERLLAALAELLADDPRADDQTRLQLQPAGDFRADSCRHRVLAVQLPAETSTDEQAHYNFITSRVDFSATTMIRAFGGLLRYLDRRPLEMLSRQPVMRIETLALEDAMYVSSGAFRTLQVFSADRHPSSFKAETTREGLSVFAVLNKCCSPLGVAQLRRMLLQPLTSRQRIEARLDAVEFFSRPANEDVVTSLQTCLRRVRNLTPLLNRMRNARALSGDWRTLYEALHGGVVSAEVCRDLPSTVPLFHSLASADCSAVQQLLHTLHQTVNLAETRELRRFTVNLGLDETLDRHKRAYAALPELLSDEMTAEQSSLPEEIQTCSMVFLPQVGFLIMVDEWRAPLPREAQRALPGLRFQFEDRGRVLYKSARCDALDEAVGDVATAIRDTETKVMVRLSALVLSATEEIHRLCALCGELDALMALARAANEFGYVRPRFVDDNILELRRSRHPLLELCADLVVPNDFSSSDGDGRRDRVKLITGANGGGKSVYLRQVALAVLMAQAGSFVAADSARLGVQRSLLTVAPPALAGTGGDAAAGGGCGSAFLAELRQLCAALGESCDRSLLVVDEFGGGTLAEDGAALLAAALTGLLARRASCPHVLVSTHVHRLAALLPPSQLVTPVCPELVLEPDARTVTFLYQMTTGAAGRSHALAAAAAACLPERLIQRAEQVTAAMVAGSDLRPDPDLLRREEERLERARRAVQTFLGADLDSEDPEALLRRVQQEYRPSEDPWTEPVVGGGPTVPGSEGPVPGTSGAERSGATADDRAGGRGEGSEDRAGDGSCQRPAAAAGGVETPVVRAGQGGGDFRPTGGAGFSSSSTGNRRFTSSSEPDTSSGPNTLTGPAAASRRGGAARHTAVYTSSSSDAHAERSARSGASEGPLCGRRPREESSTWSEGSEGPFTRPHSRAEAGVVSDAAHITNGGPAPDLMKRSAPWSTDSGRPAPQQGSRERVSNISEDPIGRPRTGSDLLRRPDSDWRSGTTSESNERLFAGSRLSQTPVLRGAVSGSCATTGTSEVSLGGFGGSAGPASAPDLAADPGDWLAATSRHPNSRVMDSDPRRSAGPSRELGDDGGGGGGSFDGDGGSRGGSGGAPTGDSRGSGAETETTPADRSTRGGYYYSHLRCEATVSTSSGLGASERSEMAAEVTERSLGVSEGSASSERGDWWLASRPLRRPRAEGPGDSGVCGQVTRRRTEDRPTPSDT